MGALDFITKPFRETGQTLEKSIEEALEKSAREARNGSKHRKHAQQPPAEPELFTGGELVIFPDKVELCGVEICGGPGDCQIRSIIDALSEKTPLGKFRALSGQALAKKIKSKRGQPAVAEAILKSRRKIATLMLTEANLKMGGRDFIDSGEWGYRFPEKISVRQIGKPEVDPPEPIITLQPSAAEAALNRRQQWFLGQVRKGKKLGRANLVAQFKTSVATAKRDLAGLSQMIEFVGPSRGGCYLAK